MSKRIGQGHLEVAQKISSQGLLIGLLLSILVGIIGIFFTRQYFMWFTDNPWIVAEGTRYTQIVTVLSLFRILAQTATSTLQGSGQMVPPMLAQLLGALLNIILDPIMIFGWWFFPAWGVTGAAIATVVSQIVSMLFIWTVLLKGNSPIKPTLTSLKPNAALMREIVQVGLPAAIMQGLGSVMLAGINLILAPFGDTALAVMGVYFKLQSLVFMPIFGLNTGTLPVVGFNFGAKNRKRVLAAVRFSSTVALVYMSLCLLVFQWIPKNMVEWFNASNEMLRIGIPALRIISMSFPFVAVTIILSGALNGLSKSTYSLMISIVRQFVILLPFAYFLGQRVGISGIWYGFVAAEISGILLTLLLFQKAVRQQL